MYHGQTTLAYLLEASVTKKYFNRDTWAKYTTLNFICNLRMGKNKLDCLFLAGFFSLVASKVRVYQSEEPFRSSIIELAPGLSHKHYTRVLKPTKNKHSSLLRPLISYEENLSILTKCIGTQHVDTRHNDTQHNDNQYDKTQRNDTEHNDTAFWHSVH
jgi:hypothetical protein